MKALKILGVKQSAVRGEPGTGFEKGGDLGEFECENCKFYDDGLCDNKIMMKRSKQPKAPDGRVKVDGEDCCEYVWRMGRKDNDKD